VKKATALVLGDSKGLTLIQILVCITLLVLVVAGLCFAAWYAGSDRGHRVGYQAGYTLGYQEANDAAWDEAREQYVFLRDPSYEEMRQFLESDDTDKNEWTWPDYVCMHFARDVKQAATAAGIRCAFVYIDYDEMKWSHFLVAFETADKGLVFIEPQTDKEMRVEPGEEYVTTEGDPFFGSTTTINRVVVAW